MFRVFDLSSKLSRSIAAGLLSLGVSSAAVSTASAQYNPQYPNPGQTGWNNTMGQTLNHQSLGDFLRSMNLPVEVIPSTNGAPIFKVPFNSKQFKGTAQISLSGDNTRLWITISLGQISQGTNTLALLQLLQQNDQTANIFSITADGNLLIKRSMDNLQVTVERFKTEVARLLATLDEARSTWQVAVVPSSPNNGQNGYPGGQSGYPTGGQNGYPNIPANFPGQQGYPGNTGGQPGYPNGQNGQPGNPGGWRQPANPGNIGRTDSGAGDVGFDGQFSGR